MDFAIKSYIDKKKTGALQSEDFKKKNVFGFGHVFLCIILQEIGFKWT